MTFERLIVAEVSCPRCNARAQLRIGEKRGKLVVVYTVCNKCKLNKYSGLMTSKSVQLISREKSLLRQLEEATSEQKKVRLKRLLENTRKEIRDENKVWRESD